MTIREQLDVYVKEKYGIDPELLPFSKEDYGVYRHPDTGKWFAVFIAKDRSAFGLPGSGEAEVISFKIRDRMLADFVAQQPGYLRGFPASNWNWTTACNYQPQRIYVMQSEEALKKVRSIRVSHFNAPLMMLVCYDVETAWRNPGDQWYENYCSGEQDATIVATTMMYEAEEVGVHSVWLRGFDSQQVAEVFDLPKNHIPVMMFAMGYPSDKTKPSPWHFQRKPIEDTVTKL